MSESPVLLAEAGGFAVWADGHSLEICRPDGFAWPLGEMYGTPVAALMTRNGRYAVIIGCGVMVCDLHRFGQPFAVGLNWSEAPVVYLKSDADDVWWFTGVTQGDQTGDLELIASLMGWPVGRYAFSPGTLAFTPLPLEPSITLNI
ncbi:hypothetical protein [Deinococcus sp.]|uniref:hypothetical protein n=1 Tax=Deinococcus sp. TaxID=47478 RepID=UPI0025E2B68E|nr:hypothetical protein [Deinococcus sp.]